ncbi:MAG: hypothetical protein QM698_04735 [Micropepsaceae bacterium]
MLKHSFCAAVVISFAGAAFAKPPLLDPTLHWATKAEEAAITAEVADMLKDPDSAKFRKITVKSVSFCGQVNGKNSYGAYSGYTHFIGVIGPSKADASKLKAVVIQLDSSDETIAYRMCLKEGLIPAE